MGVRAAPTGSLRAVLAVALVALLLAACRGPEPPPALTPREVVQRAAAAAHSLETVHFVLDTQGTTARLGSGLEVVRAEGDVRRPADVRVRATLRSAGAVLETELRVVGERAYLLNPFRAQFETLAEPPRVALLDATVGLAPALDRTADPELVRTDVENGVRVYRVRGRLPTAAIAQMIGGAPTGDAVPVELGVRDGDWQLARLVLTGAALVGDEADAVRTVVLSRWNGPVDIAPP